MWLGLVGGRWGLWLLWCLVHTGPDPQILPVCPFQARRMLPCPQKFSPAVDFLVPAPADLSFPISKGGPVVFQPIFQKNPFSLPTGKHKRIAIPAETGRAGPHLLRQGPTHPGSLERGA